MSWKIWGSRLLQRTGAAIETRAFRRGSKERVTTIAPFSLREAAPKRIPVFGDSNAFHPGDGDTCWPALLESKAPVHLSVINESYDGQTTQYDTGKRNGLSAIGRKLTCHLPLDYVIIMLGTNGMKNQYGPPSIADVAEGICRILNPIQVQGNGAKPILMTLSPLGRSTSGDLAGAQSRISSVATEFCALTMHRNVRLIGIHAILNCHTDLEPDGIQLNIRGRRKKVANAACANLENATRPLHVPVVSDVPRESVGS